MQRYMIQQFYLLFINGIQSLFFDLTPLHSAARFNRVDICKLLLSNDGTDVNTKDRIYHDMIHDVFLIIFMELQYHKFYWTPLHYATRNAHVEIAEILLHHPHINVNIADRQGITFNYVIHKTPLFFAMNQQIRSMLINKGAK